MYLNESPIYNIWRYTKAVCLNPDHRDYAKCGGIGIEVYPTWKDRFDLFHEWALKNGFKENMALVRIDKTKGFTPSNCLFITKKQNWFYSRDRFFPTRLYPVPKQLLKWNEAAEIKYNKEKKESIGV